MFSFFFFGGRAGCELDTKAISRPTERSSEIYGFCWLINTSYTNIAKNLLRVKKKLSLYVGSTFTRTNNLRQIHFGFTLRILISNISNKRGKRMASNFGFPFFFYYYLHSFSFCFAFFLPISSLFFLLCLVGIHEFHVCSCTYGRPC